MAAGRTSPVLVDREGPLAELEAALDAAARAEPAVVALSGEAGIGKSRLLAELAARAAHRGAVVAVAPCLEIGADLPFLPLAGLLRRALGPLPDADRVAIVGAAADEVARLVPELAPGSPGAPRVEDASARARLFERLLGVVGRLAADRTAVLALEDAQWADDGTAAFVAFLVRSLSVERVLVCLTRRTGGPTSEADRDRWLTELERLPIVRPIELGPLPRDAVLAQLTVLGDAVPSPAILDRVWRRSDGNPMFAEELFAAASRGERLPRALAESLDAQLRPLDPTARRALDAAAVIGRPFDERLVAAVLGRPIGEVRASLARAVDAGVLSLVDDGRHLAFRHELNREAVERALLPDDRRSLHAAVAGAIEARPELSGPTPGGPAAERAHHWVAAERDAEAFSASVEAAESAVAVAAYETADEQYERALGLLERGSFVPSDRTDAVELGRAAADAADLAGRPDRALERARGALALVDEQLEPARAGRLRSRIGYFSWVLGHGTEALEEHRRAVALVPEEPPSETRAQVVGAWAGALMGAGRYEESRAAAELAIAAAASAAAAAHEARARSVLGSDLVALGEVDAGLDELARAAALADGSGAPAVAVVAHHNRAVSLLAADRYGEAHREALLGREVARAGGLERRYGAHVLGSAADALLRLGRLRDALRAADDGLSVSADGLGTVYLDAAGARAAALLGEAAAAERWLAGADELSAGELDPDLAAYLAAARAEVALAAGRPDDALAAAVAGLDAAGPTEDLAWTAALLPLAAGALAELAADADARRDEPARARLAPSIARLASGIARGMTAVTPSARAAALLASAELERAEGRLDAAEWIAVGEAWDEVGGRLYGAYARYRAAEALLRTRTDRATAETLLNGAAATLAEIDAAPLVEAVQAIARQARVALTPPAGSVPGERIPDQAPAPRRPSYAGPALSTRELEVLALVAAGRTNGEIADALFISRKTASVHVSHILDKLGVSSRVEAAILAARLDLVGDETVRRPTSSPSPTLRSGAS